MPDELARLRRQTEELLGQQLPPSAPPAAAPAYGEALLQPAAAPPLAMGLGPLIALEDEPQEPDDAMAEAAVAWHVDRRRQVLNHSRLGAELQALRGAPPRASSIGIRTAHRDLLAQCIAALDAQLESLAASQATGTHPRSLDDLEAALADRLRSDELLCEWRQWATGVANVHRTHGLPLLHRAAVDPAASAPAPGRGADECCLPAALTTETEVEAALDSLAAEVGLRPLGLVRPARYRACTRYFENVFESTRARLRAPALEGLDDAAAAAARAGVDRLVAVRAEAAAAAEARAAGVAARIAKASEAELTQRLRSVIMPRGSQAEYTDGLGVTHHAILVGGTDRIPRIEYEEPGTRRTKAHEVRRPALLPLGGRALMREACAATQRAIDRRGAAEQAAREAEERLAQMGVTGGQAGGGEMAGGEAGAGKMIAYGEAGGGGMACGDEAGSAARGEAAAGCCDGQQSKPGMAAAIAGGSGGLATAAGRSGGLAAAVRLAVAAESGSVDVVVRPSGWLRHTGVFALGGEDGCLQRSWIDRQPSGAGAARLVLASVREQDVKPILTRVAASAREAAKELDLAAAGTSPVGSPRRASASGNETGCGCGGGASGPPPRAVASANAGGSRDDSGGAAFCGGASGGESAAACGHGSCGVHMSAPAGGTGRLRAVAPSQEALQALSLLRLARMRTSVDQILGALNWCRAVQRRVACETHLLVSRARGERADAPPADTGGGDGAVPLGAWADGLFGHWQSAPALARMEDEISPFPGADTPPSQAWKLGGGQPSVARWDGRPLLYDAAEHDLERVLEEVESRSAALLHLHRQAMAAAPHRGARPGRAGSPSKRGRGSSRAGGGEGRAPQHPETGGVPASHSAEAGGSVHVPLQSTSPTPPHGPAVASLAALGATGLAAQMTAAATASRAAVDARALVLRLLDQTVQFENTRRQAACCYLALLHHCVFPAHRAACVQRLFEILALRPSSAPPAEATAAAEASATAAGAVAAMASQVDLDGGRAAARLREAVHWQAGKGAAVQARGLQLEASILTCMLERVLSAARIEREEGGADEAGTATSARAATAGFPDDTTDSPIDAASRWQHAEQRILAGLAAAASTAEICPEAGELSALPVLIEGATSALMSRSLLPGFPQPPAACARASILALALEQVDRLPPNPEVRDALTHPALRTPTLKPILAAVRHPTARPAQGGAPAVEAAFRRRIGRALSACSTLSRLRAEVDATDRLARLDETHRRACGMPLPQRAAVPHDQPPQSPHAERKLSIVTDMPIRNTLGTGGGPPYSPRRNGSSPTTPRGASAPPLPGFEPSSPDAGSAGWFAGGGPAPALYATDYSLCPIAPRDPTWWRSVLAGNGTAPRELRMACRLQTIHRSALDIAASSNDVATSAALRRRLDEELSRQAMVGGSGAGAAVGYAVLLRPPLDPELSAAVVDAVVAPGPVRGGADTPAARRCGGARGSGTAATTRPSSLVWYGQWNDETCDVLGRMLPQAWLHAGGLCAPPRARVRQAFHDRARATAARATEACEARLKAERGVSSTAAAALASAAAADAISDVAADRTFKLDLLRQYCVDLAIDLAEPALRTTAAELTRALVSRAGPVLRPVRPMLLVRDEALPQGTRAAGGAAAVAADGTCAQDGMISGRGQLRSLTRLISDAQSLSLLKRSKLAPEMRLEALAAAGGVCGRMLQLLPLLRIRALLRMHPGAWHPASDAAAEAIHGAPDATPFCLADVSPAWEEAAGRELTELDDLLAATLPSGPGSAAAAAKAAGARGAPVGVAEGPDADTESAPAVRALGLCIGGMLLQLQLALYRASAACGEARDAAAAARGGLLETSDEAAEEFREESQLASDARALAAALAALLSISSPTGPHALICSATGAADDPTSGGAGMYTGGGLLVELPMGCDPEGDAAVRPLVVPLADSTPNPRWARVAGGQNRGRARVWVALPPSAALQHEAIANGGTVDAILQSSTATHPPLCGQGAVAAAENDAGGRAPARGGGGASSSGSGVSAGAWQAVSSPRALDPLCASRSLASSRALHAALGSAGAALLLVSAGTLAMVRAEHAHAGMVMQRIAGRAAETASGDGSAAGRPFTGDAPAPSHLPAASSHLSLTGLSSSDAEATAAAAMATAAMLSTGAAGEGLECATSVRDSVLGPPLFGPDTPADFERGGGSHAPLEPVRAWIFDAQWDETAQAPDAPPPMPNLGGGYATRTAVVTAPADGHGVHATQSAATHASGCAPTGLAALASGRAPALPPPTLAECTALSSARNLEASAASLGYDGEVKAALADRAGAGASLATTIAGRAKAGPALLFAVMAEGARLELQTLALRRAVCAATGRRAPFFDAAQLDAAYNVLVARRAAGALLPGALAPLAPYHAAIAYGTAWLAREAEVAEQAGARDRLTRAVACRTAALEETRGAAVSEQERLDSETSFVEDAFTSAAEDAGAGLKVDEAFFEEELRRAQELGGEAGGEVAHRAVAEALGSSEGKGGDGLCVLCMEGAASKPLRARLAARLRWLLSPAGSCGCPDGCLGPGGAVKTGGGGCERREWPAEVQALIDAAMTRSGLAANEAVLRKYTAVAPEISAGEEDASVVGTGSPSTDALPASSRPPLLPPPRWTLGNDHDLLHLRAKNDEEILLLIREAFRAGEPWRRNGGNAKAMRAAMAAAVNAVQAEGVPWGWVTRDPIFTACDKAEERHATAVRARRPPIVFDSPFGPSAAGAPPPPELLPRLLDSTAVPELRRLEPFLDLDALATLRSRDDPGLRVSRCCQGDTGQGDTRWDAWLQRAARIDATRKMATAERRAFIGDTEATGAWVANEVAEHRLRIALEGEAIKRALGAAAADSGHALDTQVRARLVDWFRDAVAERAASRLLRRGVLQEQALRLRAGLRRAAYDARRSTIVSLLESDSGIPVEGRRRALGRLAEEDQMQAVVDDNVRLQTLLSRLQVSSGLHRMRAAHTAGEHERRERAARAREDGLRAALDGSDETREFLQRHLAASEQALRESRAELAALTHRRDALARSNKALRRSRAAAQGAGDGAGDDEGAGLKVSVQAGSKAGEANGGAAGKVTDGAAAEACGVAPSSALASGRGGRPMPSPRVDVQLSARVLAKSTLFLDSPRVDVQLSARVLAKSTLSLDGTFSMGGSANLDAAMAVASGFASPRAERIAAAANGRATTPAARPSTPRGGVSSPRATTAPSGLSRGRTDAHQQLNGVDGSGSRDPNGNRQPDGNRHPDGNSPPDGNELSDGNSPLNGQAIPHVTLHPAAAVALLAAAGAPHRVPRPATSPRTPHTAPCTPRPHTAATTALSASARPSPAASPRPGTSSARYFRTERQVSVHVVGQMAPLSISYPPAPLSVSYPLAPTSVSDPPAPPSVSHPPPPLSVSHPLPPFSGSRPLPASARARTQRLATVSGTARAQTARAVRGPPEHKHGQGQRTVAEASKALLEARRGREAKDGRPVTAAAGVYGVAAGAYGQAGAAPPRQPRQAADLHQVWPFGLGADETLGSIAWRTEEAEYRPGEAARRIASSLYNQL